MVAFNMLQMDVDQQYGQLSSHMVKVTGLIVLLEIFQSANDILRQAIKAINSNPSSQG